MHSFGKLHSELDFVTFCNENPAIAIFYKRIYFLKDHNHDLPAFKANQGKY